MVLRHLLSAAILATSPDLTEAMAWKVAGEVMEHTPPDIKASKIAAIVYEESRGEDVRGRGVCGVLQTAARGAACDRLVADRSASYLAGIQKLREARIWCGRRGEACALQVYGGGNKWKGHRPQRYAKRVMARARAIDRAMTIAP